ncbi:MAG: hypothetical protein AUH01_06550 [Acidobacteria bacterium 13_2_20CM_56_17]|nr:MAG: hypothetical protein AUH01_06550 [Acidobacteria bacterium 13_2_20CM_56_17]
MRLSPIQVEGFLEPGISHWSKVTCPPVMVTLQFISSEASPQTNKMYFGGDCSERIIREVGSG